MPEIIPYTTREAWLADRAKDVTSTDAAALCGVSAWKTRYQLWNEKHRGMVVEREETPAMRLGKRLEAPIAQHIAAEHGFDIEPMKEYRRLPELRLGSSFDYVLRDRSALLEIKLVGPYQFSRGWRETDFGLEAPIEIEAQVQQEMLLAEIPVCFLGVLVGTETYVLRRDFDQPTADRLQREARAFWESPQPEPDFLADADFIAHLYAQATPGKVIQADQETVDLMAEYKLAAFEEAAAEKRKKVAKAKILERIGDAERVESEAYTLSAKMLAPVEVKAHVREGRRDFRINERSIK